MAEAVARLLRARQDVQVLWKMPRVAGYPVDEDPIAAVRPYEASGRAHVVE